MSIPILIITKEVSQFLIEDILEEFDFEKVHAVMTLLKWEWYHVGAVPSVSQLRTAARTLLESCYDYGAQTNEDARHETGGFIAQYYKGEGLRLIFAVADWDSYASENHL